MEKVRAETQLASAEKEKANLTKTLKDAYGLTPEELPGKINELEIQIETEYKRIKEETCTIQTQLNSLKQASS